MYTVGLKLEISPNEKKSASAACDVGVKVSSAELEGSGGQKQRPCQKPKKLWTMKHLSEGN